MARGVVVNVAANVAAPTAAATAPILTNTSKNGPYPFFRVTQKGVRPLFLCLGLRRQRKRRQRSARRHHDVLPAVDSVARRRRENRRAGLELKQFLPRFRV